MLVQSCCFFLKVFSALLLTVERYMKVGKRERGGHAAKSCEPGVELATAVGGLGHRLPASTTMLGPSFLIHFLYTHKV